MAKVRTLYLTVGKCSRRLNLVEKRILQTENSQKTAARPASSIRSLFQLRVQDLLYPDAMFPLPNFHAG